jgi:prostaglandin-H2 D-isomerase / glutathione transferase
MFGLGFEPKTPGCHCRRLAGLYSADDLQALYCDEVLDAQEALSDHIGPTIGLKREELRQAR